MQTLVDGLMWFGAIAEALVRLHLELVKGLSNFFVFSFCGTKQVKPSYQSEQIFCSFLFLIGR